MEHVEDTLPLELELLCRMRSRLTPEYSWTQNAYARDISGGVVCIDDPAAVCFCLSGIGLLEAEGLERTRGLSAELRESVRKAVNSWILEAAGWVTNNVPSWNDHHARTHPEVLAVLDAAISSARLRLTGGA